MADIGEIFYRYPRDAFYVSGVPLLIHIGILEGVSRKMFSVRSHDPLEHALYYFLICFIVACQVGLLRLPRIVLFKDSLLVIGPGHFFLLFIFCNHYCPVVEFENFFKYL